MNPLVQTVVEHVLNTLPEGLLLALCAWLLLRLLPRQNSGTRFAIWLIALAGVAGLPFLGALRTSSVLPHTHPEITLSPFWATAFLALWIPISLLALARVATGLWQVRRIRRTCSEVPIADLDPSLRVLFADLKRPVRLLVSDRAGVPAAMGFLHPVVVLPEWALSKLPPNQLRHILIHELAHIRRHDDWSNLAQKMTRAIFFFHPAVWWIDARLSLEREMACDEAVLAATGNPRAYAGCLIDLLERGCARRGWTMAQAAVARARDASLRIARILQEKGPSSTRLGRKAFGLATGVALACSGIVLCSPGLVSFAPVHSQDADLALAAGGLGDARLPAPRVVPAMYHPGPAKFQASVQPSRLGSRSRELAPPAHPARRILARNIAPKKPESRLPVVMASLKQSAPTQPFTSSAFLIVQTAQYGPVSAPRSNLQQGSAAQPVFAVQGSVLQVQMVQVVREDADGIHVQVFRIVTRVPVAMAMEGPARSI